MKALVLGVLLGLSVGIGPAVAHDAYDDSQSHPLRVLAYIVHPVGWALEWLVARPFHFVVSEPENEPIFGHEAHGSGFGGYQPYRNPRARNETDPGR